MKPQNSILTKLIILFLLIMIPVIGVSYYTLQNSNRELEREICRSIEADTSKNITKLNTDLEQIYLSNSSLTSQSNVLKLANISNQMTLYEKITSINQLREQLTGIKNANSLIENASIYLEPFYKVYNADSNEYGSFQSFDQDTYDQLIAYSQEPGVLHYFTDPITNTQKLSTLIVSQQNIDSFFIEITISQDAIYSFLESTVSYKEDYYLLNLCHDTVSYTNTNQGMLMQLADCTLPSSSYTEENQVVIDNTCYYILYYELPYANGSYIRLISTDTLLSPLFLSSRLLIIFFIIICLSCSIFFFGTYQLIHRPLTKLTDAFKHVENGEFNIPITEEKPTDFSYLYHGFNEMTENLSKLIEKDYNQKMLLQKAELKQLQAQINPHFLYNSFFMLQRMIKSDMSDEAEQMANSLSLYFRYITKNSMDTVALSDEYAHAKIYADIQALRFEGRVQIIFEELPEQFTTLKVPKLIIQPVLENAFNYGLDNKLSDGMLHVHFTPYHEGLLISIEDNGSDLTDEKLKLLQAHLEEAATTSNTLEMSGILNIQRRLVIFSNAQSSIKLFRSTLGGLCTEIYLS